MASETAIGTMTMQAAAIHRRAERVRRASKIRMLESSTHSVPPKTPVYSYHCTAHVAFAKPLPSSSHGNENSPTVYQYSVAIQPATSSV